MDMISRRDGLYLGEPRIFEALSQYDMLHNPIRP
jgi:hypothetical protein